MPFKQMEASEEYKKCKDLRKEDVISLQEWAEKQPHLPRLSEFQYIMFLQSCYFSVETAKNTIDTFFTVKTHCPEFFSKRDPMFPPTQEALNVSLYGPLPKCTPEGYTPIYCRIIDPDSSKYSFNDQLKTFDMSVMSWLAQEGTSQGIIIVNDMKNVSVAHMAKLGIMSMKKFLFYLQDAMPVRLKGLHFINVVPFMDKLLALMKPFMKKELIDMLYLHTDSIESVYKYVPKECLPEDVGGSLDSIAKIHEQTKQRIMDNKDYFAEEELQMADESRRVGKPKNVNDIFGVEGSFKKLDID